MSKGYDITIQVTIKDVRVEGSGTKAQVARAICKSMDTMDLWGLNHGRAVEWELREDGIDAEEVGFYGNTTCKVVNPGPNKKRSKKKSSKRGSKGGSKPSVSMRSIMASMK